MPDIRHSDTCRYCAGCGGRIEDQYSLMAAEKHWHVHCLQCCDCKLHLDNERTCFIRVGTVYCKEDYYRRFSVKYCAKCRQGITANEMVMRARDFVYHVTCFACAVCNKTLLPGDYFGIQDCIIYCREHYEGFMQRLLQQHNLQPSPSGRDMNNIPYYQTTKCTQKGRPRKRKIVASEGAAYGAMTGYLPENSDILRGATLRHDGFLTLGQSRQKRVRTSFKHHQLRAMKSYFQLNHNPDAKDLKQLAQRTGLSKRVLQVWFQNARAKYRRHVLKQEQTKAEGGTETEFRLSEDEKTADNTYTEMSNNSSSSLSEISSTPYLSEIPQRINEFDQENGSISDLFSSTISPVN